MKNLFNFLLVTLMLLSFTSNSQNVLTFGCGGDESFNLSDFSNENLNTNGDPGDGSFDLSKPNCGVESVLTNSMSSDVSVTYEPNLSGNISNVEFDLYSNVSNGFDVTFINNGVQYPMSFNGTTYVTGVDLTLTEIINPQILVEGQLSHGDYIRFNWVEFQGTSLTTSTANISNETLEDNFNVYNFNNTLTVETREFENYNLQVYNLSGQLVFSENTNGNFKTNISENGFFIVKLEFENKVLTKKIFVQ